jgi:hypothetical protein
VPSPLGPGGQYCILASATASDCVYDTSSYTDPANGGNTNAPGTWTETVIGAIPEPGSLGLLGAALLAFGLLQIRDRRPTI